MKPHSRATPFQNTYFIEYRLRVVTRDVNTHKVQSVECLFCVYFGRTPSKWTECQSASFDDKRIFFDNKEKFKNTIHNAFGNGEDSLVYKINPSIVQEIIGDMFFHLDDHGGISRERAIQLFTRQTTENEFTITIKKSTEFYIAVDFISHGLSFRQVENTFDSVADNLLYNRRINFKYKRVFAISKSIVYRIFKFLFIVEECVFVIEGCGLVLHPFRWMLTLVML